MSDGKGKNNPKQDTLLPKELTINFKDTSPKGGAYKPSLWLRFLEGWERIFKILGAVAVPCILAFYGYTIDLEMQKRSLNIELEMQNRTLNKEYMETALAILKDKNSTDPNLYAWAVDLLDENAPVKMDKILKEKMKTKEVRLLSSEEIFEKYQDGDPAAAVDEYTRILKNTNNEAVLYHRASAYRRIGALDSAMRDYNQLLTMNPIHSKGYHGRGIVLMQKGEQDSACVDFNKAIALGNIQALASARIHCPQASRSTELAPNSKERAYAKALQGIDQSIQNDTSNEKLYAQRAEVHNKFGKLQASYEDWGRVLALKPKWGLAYYRRGLLKVNLNKNGACADFKNALKFGYDAKKAVQRHCTPK